MSDETGLPQSRKKFLMKLSIGLGSITAAVAGIPVLSALFAPLIEKKNETWRTVGNIKDFPLKTTSLVRFKNADLQTYGGVSDNSAAWLRRDAEKKFTAFSINCTHLGCPVKWEDNTQLFMCPCHGGVYYKDGTVAVGPPLKPLTQYEVRIYNDMVQLRTAPLPITNITASQK